MPPENGPASPLPADRTSSLEAALLPVESSPRRAGADDGDPRSREPSPPASEPKTTEVLVEPQGASEAHPSSVTHDTSGANLLLSDLRFAFVLMNEARYRALARVLGVPRDQANLVSLIALMMLAEWMRSTLDRLTAGAPTSGEGMLAAASVREAFSAVAGPSSRKEPLNGTLLMIVALTGGAYPLTRRALHKLRAGAHGADVYFHRRYGWLVDPGHRRERRARRRDRALQR